MLKLWLLNLALHNYMDARTVPSGCIRRLTPHAPEENEEVLYMICDNCQQREASMQLRDMNGNLVKVCNECARELQGVDIQQVNNG